MDYFQKNRRIINVLKLITLMKSYLANRTRVVFVNCKLYNATEINCGVPQGSILGPLLFLVKVNDLPLMFPLICNQMTP